MTPTIFVGIDISKVTLDIAVIKDGVHVQSQQINNSEIGIRQLLQALHTTHQSTVGNTLYCAEHMGIYATFLKKVLYRKHAQLCLESPLRIRLSLGLQRGKSDALDAIRIADYARKNAETLILWTPARPCVAKLQFLSSLRKKLTKMSSMLKNTKKLEKYFLSETVREGVGQYTRRTYDGIQNDLAKVLKEMNAVVRSDGDLRSLVKVITSIPHVGFIIAVEMTILTNEFKDFTCPKKFSSYCGIAPFARSSGTSIRRRPRISQLANKEMKTMLHLAALGSTRPGDTVFKAYYRKKVAAGKNRMSVLNAVRNKMVRVIFACVRMKKPYEEQYIEHT